MGLTKWLEREGWEVIEANGNVLKVKATPSKVAEETDQLTAILRHTFGFTFEGTPPDPGGFRARIRAVYDPMTGTAVIEVVMIG